MATNHMEAAVVINHKKAAVATNHMETAVAIDHVVAALMKHMEADGLKAESGHVLKKVHIVSAVVFVRSQN